eukprot:4434864-Ditylum_brightwellii.AAC.1
MLSMFDRGGSAFSAKRKEIDGPYPTKLKKAGRMIMNSNVMNEPGSVPRRRWQPYSTDPTKEEGASKDTKI